MKPITQLKFWFLDFIVVCLLAWTSHVWASNLNTGQILSTGGRLTSVGTAGSGGGTCANIVKSWSNGTYAADNKQGHFLGLRWHADASIVICGMSIYCQLPINTNYVASVWTVDGGNNLLTQLGSYSAQVIGTGTASTNTFSFGSSISLTSGSMYGLALSRYDGVDTTITGSDPSNFKTESTAQTDGNLYFFRWDSGGAYVDYWGVNSIVNLLGP